MIHLRRLILNDGDSESIRECCLSAPPDDPSSVLLLTRTNKPTFVFLHLRSKKKKLRWIEMSYASQLKRISGEEGDFLHKLTCCNGKVYALNGNCHFSCFIIKFDILAKAKEVKIELSLLGSFPTPSWVHCDEVTYFLKGYCSDLFIVMVGFHHKIVEAVHLIRLNMTSVTLDDMDRFKGLDMRFKRWEEEDLDDMSMSMELWEGLVDLKDAIFFVDLVRDSMAYYRPGIASELGGYIHIRDKVDNILYSYHVKEKTISLSYMPSVVLSTSNVSLWECRFEYDHGGAKCTLDSKQEKRSHSVRIIFYNPFTRNLCALPDANYGFNAACFSAPPTSPDCMVAGFSIGDECLVLIHHVARDSSWRSIRVGAEPVSIHFLTFCGQDLYALDGDGTLIVFKELGKEDYTRTLAETIATISCCISPTRHYLMKWDQDLLKVILGKFGERVEVFKWDVSKEKWEKIDSLGNHMIYICGSTCLCIEAKTREMENKVYFPILHSKNKKIVHYSLETCTFQTFNGENIQQHLKDFFGTTHHLFPHVWIEPSWS
ncbi:hypothetical protein Tco_1281627 [Tanacetum coccineum]